MSAVCFSSAVPDGRPVRLSAETRRFAFDSLDAVYGRALRTTPCVELDDVEGFAGLSKRRQYDLAVRRIAETAPIRFCARELLCGSATLLDAVRHMVPARFDGELVLQSVSHLTCAFDEVLRQGLDPYEQRILTRLPTADEPGREALLSMLNALQSLRVWHGRYLSALRERIAAADREEDRLYYIDLYRHLRRVPFSPPQNFREGLQALWFTFAFTRLTGNWPGLGRVDEMLGGLLEADLAAGAQTMESARELVAHFFIKGCEWITHDVAFGGDAQHYQNIVLGGVDADGQEVTNTLTRLILEVVEELPISDFPIAVRVGPGNPDWLVPLAARVMRHGSGVCAVYNERLVIQSMVDFGYDLRAARCFANDGCWEVQAPGKTSFIYAPMDLLLPFQRDVLGLLDESPREYDSFEQLYSAFRAVMEGLLEQFHRDADTFATDRDFPCGVISLLEDDCIANAREYRDRGARYNVLSPHFGGIPDVANSLLAIKKLVFEERRLSFSAFMDVLRRNWEGEEPLRQYVQNQYTYYGNDDDQADGLAARIVGDYLDIMGRVKERCGVLRPAGISTFGRQIEWSELRTASAHGHKAGDILAGNLSPTPGTDFAGATAVIRSHCKTGLSRLTGGTALDIKLDPTAASGTEGLEAIESLIRGFCALDGFFMQIDVQNNEVLRDAQRHPEKYPTLSVRLSGWSARFITLDENWQRMVIERTAGGTIGK